MRAVAGGAAIALTFTRGCAGEVVMRVVWLVLVVLATLSLGGCEVVGDIFRAGMWVGMLGVLLVIGLIAFLAMKLRSGLRSR